MSTSSPEFVAQRGRWERMFAQAQGFLESGNPHDALARVRVLQRELEAAASAKRAPEMRAVIDALRERARVAAERYEAANQAWYSELEQRFSTHVANERALLQRPLRSTVQ